MFLTVPISKLLCSQLDIGIDPRSGNFTYNIKDTPSLRQYGYAPGNLMLTLQSPAGDGDSIVCLRICTNFSADFADQSMDTSQAFEFATAPTVSTGQSDQHCTFSAEMFAPSIPMVHSQGFSGPPSEFQNLDGAGGPYSLCSPNHVPPEPAVYQASPWDVPQEKNPQPYQEPSLMSPISRTLSLIASGAMFDDSTTYGPFDFSGHTNLHSHADYTYATMTGYPTPSCPSEHTFDIVHGRDLLTFEEGSEPTASCASHSTMNLPGLGASVQNSPLLLHAVPSVASSSWAATGVTEDSQSIQSQVESSGSNQEASTYFPTASASLPDGCVSSELSPQSRKDKNKGYPCPYATCNRVLKNHYTQQLHMKTHTAKSRKDFTCTMGCSESFTRHHDRLRHEVSQHGKECEFSCKPCDRFFSSQRMLERHTCWSSRIGPLRWQLKDCGDTHSEA